MEEYLGLFISAFLAATVLPFSSEAVLAGLTAFGDADVIGLPYVAEADDRLEELDINPLMVTPHGAVAADALIGLREKQDD